MIGYRLISKKNGKKCEHDVVLVYSGIYENLAAIKQTARELEEFKKNYKSTLNKYKKLNEKSIKDLESIVVELRLKQ